MKYTYILGLLISLATASTTLAANDCPAIVLGSCYQFPQGFNLETYSKSGGCVKEGGSPDGTWLCASNNIPITRIDTVFLKCIGRSILQSQETYADFSEVTVEGKTTLEDARHEFALKIKNYLKGLLSLPCPKSF